MASVASIRQRFQDNVVFITGAAHGMGRSHALAFAQEGAKLVLCDACRQYETVPYPLATPQELAALSSEIKSMGNPVIAALRKSKLDVTAIHSHMLDEEPRLFFLHFWGHGDPAALAEGLRAALARTNSAPAK